MEVIDIEDDMSVTSRATTGSLVNTGNVMSKQAKVIGGEDLDTEMVARTKLMLKQAEAKLKLGKEKNYTSKAGKDNFTHTQNP